VQVETGAGGSRSELVVQRSAAELVAVLPRAFASQRRFTLVSVTSTGAELTARPNWATWGARIRLRFVPLEGTGTTVEARWAPALPTTAVTWGQGRRDLVAIGALLRS
jgi:hypothetical protein